MQNILKKTCVPRSASVVVLGLGLLLIGPAVAQSATDDVGEIRRQAELFSGVLRDSLELNAGGGIFNPAHGNVRSRYLAGQGVVFEISLPARLGRAWGGPQLQGLSRSLDDLSAQVGDMMQRGLVVRPDLSEVRDAMALSLRTDDAARIYQEELQALTRPEGLAGLERALSSAVQTVSRLQVAGQLTPEAAAGFESELQTLREQLREQIGNLTDLRRTIRDAAVTAEEPPAAELSAAWRDMSAQINTRLDAIREQVAVQTEQLRVQQQALRVQQQERWQENLQGLETRLYTTLCDFAGGLRVLPDGEHVTIVLTGAGQTDDATQRRDRVHVVQHASIQACLRDEITAEDLRARSVSYDY